MAQPLLCRAMVPDRLSIMVIGHVTGDTSRLKAVVDTNIACYSRDLFTTIEEHVKVCLILATLGVRLWPTTVSDELLLNVEVNMPDCIRPVASDTRRMALTKLNRVDDVSEVAADAAVDGFSNSANPFNFAANMDVINVDDFAEPKAVSPLRQLALSEEATVPLQNAVQSVVQPVVQSVVQPVVGGPIFHVGQGAVFNYYCAPPPAPPAEE
jgi:hypothetical protein